MSKPIERIVKTNGISLNVVEHGQGPLVLLCHGFPEISYSWRRQINSLAEAGFQRRCP
jgi:pimeloyl-ACP methyl ester carboxylesterase